MLHEPAWSAPTGGHSDAAVLSGKRAAIALVLFLALSNVALWAVTVIQVHAAPALIGVAFVVYGLGLRHAIDVDHIAAIDNVTRKLILDGQRPIATGFFFALGHSSIVLVVTALATWLASTVAAFEHYRVLAASIGAAFSALFFLVIAALNAHVFLRLLLRPRAGLVRPGAPTSAEPLIATSLMTRSFARLLRLVGRSRDMFFVGLLFGLGFDTASEVALVGTTAVQFSKGLSLTSVLLFPLLFTAAMTLVDTFDGIVMLRVYDWARIRPERTRIYNGAITLISAVVSALLAAAAGSQLLDVARLHASAFSMLVIVRTRSEAFGLGVTAALLTCWLVSWWTAKRSR